MRSFKKEFACTLMIAPAIIGFTVLFILPMLMSFGYSLTDWSAYTRTLSFVGLENYRDLFKDKVIGTAITNSLKYAVVMTIAQNGFAILFAVLLHRNTRINTLMKSILFLPAVLSIMVVGYLFSYIMSSADHGLLNRIIISFGGSAVNWLGNAKLALYSVLITQVWQWTGWAMVIYIANIKTIDPALYESAQIDGASPFRTFTGITLPLLYPAASFNLLLSVIGSLKVFDAVFAMTNGGPGNASATMMTLMIRTGFNRGLQAYACAFAVVFFLLVFTISRIIMFFLNRWEASIS
jgi:raffinose/stachyose/melibiose transport system permease protein